MRRRPINDERPEDTEPVEDAPTLETLYRRYSAWLTAKLRGRFGASIADTEDLVQETYLRVAPYQRDRVIRYPQAFLLRVASNLVREELRRRPRPMNSAAAVAITLEPQADGHEATQLEALLYKQVVLAIPQPYRDVFMLSRFGNLTHGEIADHLGVSIKTVEWRMAQALAFCARRLKD